MLALILAAILAQAATASPTPKPPVVTQPDWLRRPADLDGG
jgi:hypothetical protein